MSGFTTPVARRETSSRGTAKRDSLAAELERGMLFFPAGVLLVEVDVDVGDLLFR